MVISDDQEDSAELEALLRPYSRLLTVNDDAIVPATSPDVNARAGRITTSSLRKGRRAFNTHSKHGHLPERRGTHVWPAAGYVRVGTHDEQSDTRRETVIDQHDPLPRQRGSPAGVWGGVDAVAHHLWLMRSFADSENGTPGPRPSVDQKR
jgi:hypothetical protein